MTSELEAMKNKMRDALPAIEAISRAGSPASSIDTSPVAKPNLMETIITPIADAVKNITDTKATTLSRAVTPDIKPASPITSMAVPAFQEALTTPKMGLVELSDKLTEVTHTPVTPNTNIVTEVVSQPINTATTDTTNVKSETTHKELMGTKLEPNQTHSGVLRRGSSRYTK